MDENRKLDVAKIAAERWASANNNASRTDSKTYAAEVAQVFKDVYEALGDKQEVANQEPTLGQLDSYEAYANYMHTVNKINTTVGGNSSLTGMGLGDALKKAQDGPQWVEVPVMDGVYFADTKYDSLQARWVLVSGGLVFWFDTVGYSTIADSCIKRFYGPMKAPT